MFEYFKCELKLILEIRLIKNLHIYFAAFIFYFKNFFLLNIIIFQN